MQILEDINREEEEELLGLHEEEPIQDEVTTADKLSDNGISNENSMHVEGQSSFVTQDSAGDSTKTEENGVVEKSGDKDEMTSAENSNSTSDSNTNSNSNMVEKGDENVRSDVDNDTALKPGKQARGSLSFHLICDT